MDELSNKKIVLSDDEVIDLGFCPHCHCPDSRVNRTCKVNASSVRLIQGRKKRVSVIKIVRYRQCDLCSSSFRTVEVSEQ